MELERASGTTKYELLSFPLKAATGETKGEAEGEKNVHLYEAPAFKNDYKIKITDIAPNMLSMVE